MTLQFMTRDPESSVYKSVSDMLRSQKDVWTEQTRNDQNEATFSFDLMLGERVALPFHRLGQNPGLLQLVNYYRGGGNICRKCSMVRTFKRYYNPRDLHKWLPESFIIFPRNLTETGAGDNEGIPQHLLMLRAKRKACDEREKCIAFHADMMEENGQVVWIAKSSAGCKGEGIRINENIDELLAYIDRHKQGFILQRYITSPMLLPGERKFDVRIWVVLDPNMRILAFKEGVLRTASEPYNPGNWSDLTSHLTNHSIQEARSENFGKYEKDNEMFFAEFSRLLKDSYGMSLDNVIKQRAYAIIAACFKPIKQDICTEGLGYRSFQLFGFDFLIDKYGVAWLLEVNGAPASAQRLLPKLTEGIVNCVINSFFLEELDEAIESKYFDRIEDKDDLFSESEQ